MIEISNEPQYTYKSLVSNRFWLFKTMCIPEREIKYIRIIPLTSVMGMSIVNSGKSVLKINDISIRLNTDNINVIADLLEASEMSGRLFRVMDFLREAKLLDIEKPRCEASGDN